MEILHISPSTNGYEEATLKANRVSRKNHLALIVQEGVEYMTGGFLINDTPEIRKVLDNIPKNDQYNFVKLFKMDPWAKSYEEEDED